MPILIVIILVTYLCSSFSLANALSPSAPENKTTSLIQTDQAIYGELKNVSDAAHHLQKTIQEIIFEVTRQDYAIASEPNVIGPMVIPAIPPPTGAIPVGIFFPPRKKYMDLYAEQSHKLLIMLAEENAALPTNIENDSVLSHKLENIKQHIDALRTESTALEGLMTGPSYNNLSIGKQAVQISDEIDQMKKLFKDTEKEIHTDIKQIEK